MNSHGQQHYDMTRYLQQNRQTGQQSISAVEQQDIAQQQLDPDQNLRVCVKDDRMHPFRLPGNNTNGKMSSVPQRNSQQVNRHLPPQMQNSQTAFILAKQQELQSYQGQLQPQKKQNLSSVNNTVESKKKNKRETKMNKKDQNGSKKQKQTDQSIPHSRTRGTSGQENENLQLAGEQNDQAICYAPKHIYLNLDLISSASKRHPNSTKVCNVNQGICEEELCKSASTKAAHYGNYFKTAKVNSAANSENQDCTRKFNNHALETINKEASFASDTKRKISERYTAGHESHSQTVLSNTIRTQFQSHSASAHFKAIQAALNSSPKMNLADGNFYHQENALSRNTFWIEHTKAHKKLLAEHYSEEEMKECSFSPKFFASKAARKCYVTTHNDFEQVNQSLNPEFHKLAADSKSSYSSLYAFKKQMGFAMPLKSAHS